MSEAFVYMWYDSKNSMYYIGYHKGTPDDGYTHTSSIMESFKIAPKGFRRRILAYGTRDEMMQLESDLLKNRKEKCWNKYYNVIIQFPPLPMYGKNNPNWKHGLAGTPEYEAMRKKKYKTENVERLREARKKHSLENVERLRESTKKYRQENREKIVEYQRKYSDRYREKNREEILEKKKKYREENREKANEYAKKRYQEKKKQQKECTFIPVDQY